MGRKQEVKSLCVSCRQALLSSALLPPLAKLLDDSSISCRRNVHRVLNHLSLLPAGSRALLSLVPKLMLKLQEEKDEEEEVQVLLLSTLCCCSRLDPVPALACDGIPLLRRKLSHPSPSVRREAAAAMMALRSVGRPEASALPSPGQNSLTDVLFDRLQRL